VLMTQVLLQNIQRQHRAETSVTFS
jgi:hypothetical protein